MRPSATCAKTAKNSDLLKLFCSKWPTVELPITAHRRTTLEQRSLARAREKLPDPERGTGGSPRCPSRQAKICDAREDERRCRTIASRTAKAVAQSNQRPSAKSPIIHSPRSGEYTNTGSSGVGGVLTGKATGRLSETPGNSTLVSRAPAIDFTWSRVRTELEVPTWRTRIDVRCFRSASDAYLRKRAPDVGRLGNHISAKRLTLVGGDGLEPPTLSV